jgi:predicted RNA-binding protein (virulence factor B family)
MPGEKTTSENRQGVNEGEEMSDALTDIRRDEEIREAAQKLQDEIINGDRQRIADALADLEIMPRGYFCGSGREVADWYRRKYGL